MASRTMAVVGHGRPFHLIGARLEVAERDAHMFLVARIDSRFRAVDLLARCVDYGQRAEFRFQTFGEIDGHFMRSFDGCIGCGRLLRGMRMRKSELSRSEKQGAKAAMPDHLCEGRVHADPVWSCLILFDPGNANDESRPCSRRPCDEESDE